MCLVPRSVLSFHILQPISCYAWLKSMRADFHWQTPPVYNNSSRLLSQGDAAPRSRSERLNWRLERTWSRWSEIRSWFTLAWGWSILTMITVKISAELVWRVAINLRGIIGKEPPKVQTKPLIRKKPPPLMYNVWNEVEQTSVDFSDKVNT